MSKTVLVLGGAGFIGSHIAKRFCSAGYRVTIIDGLLEYTGARLKNLEPIISKIQLISEKVENIAELKDIVQCSDIIIDSMAWTSHVGALSNPEYDLELNLKSHLHLIQKLKEAKNGKILIYLGSRVQYGQVLAAEITEETPMVPIDIQGVHKVAAESYYRIYSKLFKQDVISIRFPNCFGENQPFFGDDIGLVGGFIRDLLDEKTIEVFGSNRMRYLLYVEDLAEIVFKLSGRALCGFSAINVSGHAIKLENLAKLLVDLTEKGAYRSSCFPNEIKNIDVGNALINEKKLIKILGNVPKTDIRDALKKTIAHLKVESFERKNLAV
jgi:UDP-glucose 4-epimerase